MASRNVLLFWSWTAGRVGPTGLVPDFFRSSQIVTALLVTNSVKAKGTGKFMILVPLFDQTFPKRTRRLKVHRNG